MTIRKGILAGVLAASMAFGQLSGLIPFGVTAHAVENVALNKPVTVSEVDSDTPSYKGELTVDGVIGNQDSDTSRWSGGVLKEGVAGNKDQWLVIDLKAAKTTVESIKVHFYKLVWSKAYRIETSEDATGGWTEACQVDSSSRDGGTQNPTDEISGSNVSELKRYVRFFFPAGSLNQRAGGTKISIREIEILGTQEGAMTGVSTAAEALGKIGSLSVGKDDTQLALPNVSEDYEISVHGSEVGQLIGKDGSLSPCRIGSRSFNLILKAVNKANPADTAKKSVTVTVEGNTGRFYELFPQVDRPNPAPGVLPTVQEWYGYEGAFLLTDNAKIIVNDKANVGLNEVAKELKEDLQDICGKELPIEAGTAGSEGNIYLESLKEDAYGTGEEGYLLVNGEQGIQIFSTSRTGALYGTVTAEQILYQDPARSAIPKGVIRDYPLYGTRGIMFDVARIPTRMQFLTDYSKILKWYKLNTMQIHLNDNQWSEPAYSPDPEIWKEVEASHRLESELFPSLATQESKFLKDGDNPGRYDYYFDVHTGTGGELYYTKDAYRALEADMGRRGVKLIAELDTPGHSAAYNKYVYYHQKEVVTALVNYGYLDRDAYLNADGSVKKSFYIHNPANFELLSIDEDSSAAAVAENARNAKIFMTALFDEYMGGIEGIEPTFTTDTVSAGVDEYWQKTDGTRAAFGKYINYMHDLLGQTGKKALYSKQEDGYGKEMIVWGAFSQFPVSDTVGKDITVALWNSGYEDDPIARLEEGFSLINIPQPFLYTTPGRYHKDMLNEAYVYYNWDPTKFTGSVSAEKGEPQLKGAMGALWGDENREGITEADLNERYLRLAAMVGEKDWGGGKEGDTFLSYEQKFDRLREGPGTQVANRPESKTNVVLDYQLENLSGDKKTLYDASGNGYHGTVTGGETVWKEGEAMLKFDGKTKIETPLTSLSYPYTVSFDVYLDGTEENDRNSAIFGGYDGRLFAAGHDGNLGLSRDYFTQSFGSPLARAKKQRVTIVGTYQATKLYVDGKFEKILYAAASDPDHGGNVGVDTKVTTDADNNFRSTFVFPLSEIGERFQGYLGRIKAYKKALSEEELATEGEAGVLETDVARNCHAYSDNKNSAYDTDMLRLFPAWKATDGDGHVTGVSGASASYESKWHSSNHSGDYLMVDLGQARDISKVTIDWDESRYAAAYDIEASMDGILWTTVASATGNTSARTTDAFEKKEARYVRMKGKQFRQGAGEYAIYEMKAFETVDKAALAAECQSARAILSENGIGWESAGIHGALHQSYLEASAVLTDVMAGQSEADAAAHTLSKAAAQWKEGAPAIQKGEALLSKQAEYTKESWSAFVGAYQALAETDAELSSEEYAALVLALKEAIHGLKPAQTKTQLEAPAILSVKSQKTGVKVTVQPVPHAAFYQLYRKVGKKAVKVGGAVTGTVAYDKAPVGGKTVSYYAVALAGADPSYADSKEGSAKSVKLPSAPNKVTAAQVKGKKAVSVKWSKVKGASSYLLFRATGKNGAYKQIASVKKKVSCRDGKNLKKGKTYYYKVVAVSGKKYSPMKAAKKSVKIKL